MRIVVIGGFGNFGARICRDLATVPGVQLIATGRSPAPSPINRPMGSARLDLATPGFATDLAQLAPDLVIHCAGPFQGQDYRVAQAALSAKSHYIDLSDGRKFVAGFAPQFHSAARAAGVLMVSGASTVPALSSAVVDAQRGRFRQIEEIHIAIAPGQRAPRGQATIAAVLSYAGRRFRWLRKGVWRDAWGWQKLERLHFAGLGARWAAACDIPDLELFVQRYAGVETIEFRAALELGIQHFALWAVAWLRRIGLPLPIERLAAPLNRTASLLNHFGSDRGGMLVSISGIGSDRVRRHIEWHLTAADGHGPEIPCMATTLLAANLARGELAERGAFACMGLLKLVEFEQQFARWGITTQIKEISL
jgi:saccharopine dehydrogenase-like NADP-dependent oxidoreductase